jgi:catechol 2,3-dioxygenase-like lactoylglutathione lyase family enzyme
VDTAKLWNIGARVENVEAEIAFFVALGGKLRLYETIGIPAGAFEYALIDFAGTRLFLTPKTVFEDELATPVANGLTHAVFEVADLDDEIARLEALGTEMLIPPVEISAGFGSRRLAFFRSPGGIVFEVMQIRESLV